MTGAAGQVVLLNGVSSSGKSTIARRLLDDFDTPWFHLAVDMFGAMRAERQTHELDPAATSDVLRRTRAGFHRAVAGMAQAGNNIVMDHVLSESWRLRDLLTVMAGIDVVFVGVHCSESDLRARESARGDRAVGSAATQLAVVHSYGGYDVDVNTTTDTGETCSEHIRNYLHHHPAPGVRAFDRMRAEQL
ncbi:chloramphenicol phosphotransferase CPT family protein [Mycobacterium sp. NPDC003449]